MGQVVDSADTDMRWSLENRIDRLPQRLYGRRWYNLLVIAGLNVTNAMVSLSADSRASFIFLFFIKCTTHSNGYSVTTMHRFGSALPQ